MVLWSLQMFLTLEQLGSASNFIKWAKVICNCPIAAVITNGVGSAIFEVQIGSRWGCQLSALQFALVIEPLTEAHQCDREISGLGQKSHKITSYADDVLLCMSNPCCICRCLIQNNTQLNAASRFKINLVKAEALPPGNWLQAPVLCLCQMISHKTIIAPEFHKMFKVNFTLI